MNADDFRQRSIHQKSAVNRTLRRLLQVLLEGFRDRLLHGLFFLGRADFELTPEVRRNFTDDDLFRKLRFHSAKNVDRAMRAVKS